MPMEEINGLDKVGVIAQRQKNFFLIRLKTAGGALTSNELATISHVSRKLADGRVHLTTRQGVEIHNIHMEKLREAVEELEKNGIALGACGPRGRGIVACPGNATCTSGLIETQELAKELDTLYFCREAPHKFKIGISGCPNNCSKPVENDVGVMGGVLPGWLKKQCSKCRLCVSICPVQAIGDSGEEYSLDREKCILCGSCIKNCPVSAWAPQKAGYTLYLGGTMGRRPRLGTKAKALIESKVDLKKYIERAFDFYVEHGRKKERFGHTMDRMGAEYTLKAVLGERNRMVDLRGLRCPMHRIKAKTSMDRIEKGETLEFFIDEGEPMMEITSRLKSDGHKVINVGTEDNYFKVLVEKI